VTSKLERMLGTARPLGFCLEIGARDAPLLHKGAHDVAYVDYAPTDVLKANQTDPVVRVDRIVDVDVVWGDRPLAESAGRPVDYVVASHVVEHVPDLIGWLLELSEALRPGGVLGLAVPDKRFTFDVLRQETVLAEVVEAYLLRRRQPSLRQVFDAASLGLAVDTAEVWAGRFVAAARRAEVLARLQPALGLARSLCVAPRYNDAHCWVFTPASLLRLMEEIAVLGLFPYRVEAFFPTEPGELEFQVRLVRAARADAPEIRSSIAAAQALISSAAPVATAEDAVTAEAESLRRQLGAVLASKSWRLTAPLRALRRLTSM
jgi:hypothetical protein